MDEFGVYRFLQKKINDPTPEPGSKYIVFDLPNTLQEQLNAWIVSELADPKDFTDNNNTTNHDQTLRKKGCFAYGENFSEPYKISKNFYRTIHSNAIDENIAHKLHGYTNPKDMKIGEKLNIHRGHTAIDDKEIVVTIQNIFKLNGKHKSTSIIGSSYYILFLIIKEDHIGEQIPPEGKQQTDQFIFCVRGDESIRDPDKSVLDKVGHGLLSFIQPKKGGRKTHKKRVSKKKHTNKRTKKRRRTRR